MIILQDSRQREPGGIARRGWYRRHALRRLVAAAVIAAAWQGNAGVQADPVVDLLKAVQPAATQPMVAQPAGASHTAATQPPTVSAPVMPRPAPRTAAKVHLMAQRPAANPKEDGPAFAVSQFVLGYKYQREVLPPITRLMNLPLHLGLSSTGYVAVERMAATKSKKRPQYPVTTLTLAEINTEHGIKSFHSSAVESIERQLVQFINQHGIIGVYIQIAARDFRGQRDLRSHGDTTLHLTIHEAIVQEVRTVSSGQGFGGKKHIDNAGTAFIRDNSPIHATTVPAAGAAKGTDDILNKHWLDDYVLRLNQQPGRQVSVALSPGSAPDSVILDYLVHERKPWMAYAQISNTGTPQTNDWVEQFGFIDNELTGHDDILNLNYDTAGFDSTQDVNGSYQFPIFGIDRLQARIFGGYQQYNASNVGLSGLDFNGRTSFGGGELILNFAQFRNIFLYSVLGAQYQHATVDNVTSQVGGTANFVLPYLSLRMDRTGKTSHQTGSLTVLGQYTNASSQALNNLGRLNTNPTWTILQGNFTDSFYLEPIFDHRNFADGQSTLANEILLRASGQEAFGQRLIPQEEVVTGGLYSVRGYPQSIVAGDNGIYGTVQYNLHIPRLFPVDANPKSTLFGHIFRTAPQTPYGRPDWDLVVSAFVDGGVVGQSQQQSYETGSTLLSTGLGAKVVFEKNISAEVDWGVALHSVSPVATGQGGVSAGSSQFNFVFSVSY